MARDGIRTARNLSAATVAAIAAWSSYSHMVHVALHYGERAEVAYGLPFSVDGMLVVASAVMVDDRRNRRRVRPVARLAFVAGVTASVAANIAAAHPHVGARVVAAWPALALLLVVEMLSRPGTASVAAHESPAAEPAAGTAEIPPAGAPVAGTHPLAVEVPVAGMAVTGKRHPAVPLGEVPVPQASGQVPSAPAFRPPRRHSAAASRAGSRRPTQVTRRLALQLIADQPHLTRGEIAARLGVSARRLREVLATET